MHSSNCPKAELLQDASEALIESFIDGEHADEWVFQEKYNGERRFIEKQPIGDILDYNRSGEPGKGLSSAPGVIAAVKNHPLHQMVIDVELVGPKIFVFDALCLGDEIVLAKPYSYREPSYHREFDGFSDYIVPVVSARTRKAKRLLMQRLRDERAEGLVAKKLKAIYRPACKYNYRLKFWKDLDAVVLGDSKERDDNGMLKDSVRLGLFDAKGRLHDICGATKKCDLTLRPGDVVKVKYLYGTDKRKIVQIDILEPRDDKRPEDCTLDQIIINKNWEAVA